MKINTNLKALGVAATMLTGFVLGGSATAFAEEGAEDKYERTYDSNTIIEFEVDETGSITPPVDPTNPGKPGPVDPVDPTDPNGPKPGTPGPLSIDYASSLDFGKPTISSTTQIYKAKAQQFGNRDPKEGPNYVQVTDNRGTEKGWKLQVKQNGQFKIADSESTHANKELTGAEISFANGQVNTASLSKGPSTVNGGFTLNPDGSAQTIMDAKAGEGSGTYVLAFGTDATAGQSIELKVPGSATKYAGEKYATSLTWTLTDVPEQE